MGETTKKAMLKRAVERAGMDAVSKRLGAPASLIDDWIKGMATMPDRKFLALVDIIDELNKQ
jgi:hypothetical protein